MDLLAVAVAGLRARKVRAVLSALGIALGIAAMIAVVGISASARADLDEQLQRLGTNLLTVGPGKSLFGDDSHLPSPASSMIGRIAAVAETAQVGHVAGVHVYRNDKIPAGQTGSIAVLAAGTDLLAPAGATVASGTFLNEATASYPAVVLGASAAQRLGAGPGQQVHLGGAWFTVLGVLAPVILAPELDAAALVGWPVAQQLLGFDGFATTIYARVDPDAVVQTAALLAATANPEHPDEVQVSRPSDALAAGQAADAALAGVLLGLGAVALLVGGVGVANTMVISVLERRGEIGLRRALGATRGQIRLQFLAESLFLSGAGGFAGVVVGVVVTAGYATVQGWTTAVPAWAAPGAVGATLVVGALAGLYPAARAARMHPTEALAAP